MQLLFLLILSCLLWVQVQRADCILSLDKESNELELRDGVRPDDIDLILERHEDVKTTKKTKQVGKNSAGNSASTIKNNVILFLVKRKDEGTLINAITSVVKNVPMEHSYPLLFLHTGDYDDLDNQRTLAEDIKKSLNSQNLPTDIADRIEFEKLIWTLPDSVPNDVSIVKPVRVRHNNWPGYNHMCHFFATEIFYLPKLKDVKYYMRLDMDSEILSPLCEDPFVAMDRENKSYGYRAIRRDPRYVIRGLYKFIHRYTQTRNDLSDRLDSNQWEWPKINSKFDSTAIKSIYNNFEIVNLDKFRRRKDVKEFFDEINKEPLRFYKYRWGDATLRYATLNLFFDFKKDSKMFCDFSYHHKHIFKTTCSCESDKGSNIFDKSEDSYASPTESLIQL